MPSPPGCARSYSVDADYRLSDESRRAEMETGVFLLGGVEMADAGAGPPLSTDRRYDNETVWETSERMLDMGVKAEEVGLDIFWLTEHHFQYEGYEVIPNALLFGAVL